MESNLVFKNISVEGPAIAAEELTDKVEEVRHLLLAERAQRALSEDTVTRLVDLATQDLVVED